MDKSKSGKNVLFEKYVERVLSQALAGTGLRVSSQGGHRDCLYEGDIGRFRTRPDIIVRDAAGIALIIDTKWKRMTPRIDDPKQGVSQADVYQLMAYGEEAERHTKAERTHSRKLSYVQTFLRLVRANYRSQQLALVCCPSWASR